MSEDLDFLILRFCRVDFATPMSVAAVRLSLSARFALVSLTGLLAAAILMALIFHRHNAAMLRTTAENQNAAMTRILGNLIYPAYKDFFAQAGTLSADAIRAHPRTQALRHSIAEVVSGTPVTKVKIYDRHGRVLFSSTPAQIGVNQSANEGFALAMKGKIASELTYRNTFDAFEGVLADRHLLSSYVPIFDMSASVEAVFEIYLDVSAVVHQMEDTRSAVVFMVGPPLLLVFIFIFLFVRRADRLIAVQQSDLHEANQRLETRIADRTEELLHSNRRLQTQVREVEDAEAQVQDISDKLQRLLEIEQRLSSEPDLGKLVSLAMTETTDYIGADRSTLFLFDWKDMQLSARFAEGLAEGSISIPLRMGIVGTAILNRKTYNVSNAHEHPYFNPTLDQVLNFRTESILVAPILSQQGRPLGGLQLLNHSNGRFTPVDQQMAEQAAQSLSAGLEDANESSARAVAGRLHQAIPCDRVTIFRLDPDQGQLVSLFADGVDASGISLGMRLGIAGLVAVTGQETVIDDAQTDPRFDRQFDNATGYVTTSMMCLPLCSRKGESLGVVQVINKRGGRFDKTDLDVLRSLVGVIAVFIENAMLLEDQDRQFHSTLNVMAASIDAKDTLTAGHSHRVAVISRGIAREMGFSESELDVLHVAALLHDYGKIGVSDAVLKKEGKLSDEEYAHIKLHARMTHSILDKIFFARKYRAVPLIAGSHHECLDGSGYPQGLTAKQIPFMSKVLSVADVFEALTADRHYRKGMTAEDALRILRNGAGNRFDPNVVAAIERIAQRGEIPPTSQSPPI